MCLLYQLMTHRLSKILLYCSILVTFLACHPLGRVGSMCSKYQTGKYVQHLTYSGSDHIFKESILIDRTWTTQMEISEMTRDTVTYKVHWLTPCIFELIYLYSSDLSRDRMINEVRDHRPGHKLVSGNELYYLERVKKVIDTMWIRQ